MDRMTASAPLFMVSPEIMKEIQEKLASTSISDTPRIVTTEDPEKPSGHEFLNMLHAGMPPAGRGYRNAVLGGSGDYDETISEGGYPMGLTENAAATYLSSGNRCLDFFFQVVPTTPEPAVVQLISLAWQEDALTALKLIFHLRGVRGTGKSDKERFYHAALWLHENHPATLCANAASIAAFGYFKDLLEVLLRLVEGREGALERAKQKQHHGSEKFSSKFRIRVKQRAGRIQKKQKGTRRGAKDASPVKSRAERIAASLEKDRAAMIAAASLRREKREDMARRAAKKFYCDSRFQALYLEVAKLFAERLKGDIEALQEDRLSDISLAGKWTPSLDSSYDLRTVLCYAIATKIYPKEDHAEYADVSDQKYGFAIRERLRREVLVPLRKVLELPEVYMSAQRWGDVNYRRVASVAMSRYKKHFTKHDEERFSQFLKDVETGKEKVAAGALFPHDIVKAAMSLDESSAKVADLQWKRMVDDLRKLGTLSNCIAICDVSGSMYGEPMEVCIALGILLSELSEEPWKGNIITFSQQPSIHKITGNTLQEKARSVKGTAWGMNTNLQLVFERILKMAEAQKLAPEKMIKRVFIFSDMEFDQACSGKWETDYDAILRKFKKRGFGQPPEIVFWNLRHSSSIPVIKSEPGVALVSGFSKNMLKIFLQKDGEINPMLIMNEAISGEEYAALKVVD